MGWLEVVAAAGWFPGVFLSGYWLTVRLGVERPHERWVLAPAVGLSLWTVPMLLAGGMGFFHPWAFGLAGWGLTALLVFLLEWRSDLGRLEMSTAGWLVLAVAAVYGVLSLVYTGETFLGGRDQGGYANHALHIARTGGVWVPFPFESFAERRFRHVRHLQALSNLGFPPSRMEGQFHPVYTIWMAQTVGVFGRLGVLGFNSVLAALTVPLFYRLARGGLGRPAALIALCVFLLNPAQLWMPRITLSEISAQHLVIAAMLCLVGGWSARRLRVVGLGGLLLGTVFWIRIDGLVFAPTLAVALAAILIWGERRPASGASDLGLVLTVGWVALAVFVAGSFSYLFFTEEYFSSIGPLLLRIIGLTVVLILVALTFINGRFRNWTAGILGRRSVAFAVSGLLLLLVAWAYWVRPVTEPFALMGARPDLGRSFRENSLVNLVAYLSEPAALLALVGLIVAVWALLQGRMTRAWILPTAAWAGFTVLYLYDPSISPDHIWAVRRFVPVVIPGCALLAGFGFEILTRRSLSRRGQVAATVVVGLILALVMLPRSSVFLFLKENRGTEAFLADLDAQIRPGSLVFADTSTLFFDPLYPGLGHRVVRVDLGDKRMPAVIETIIRENADPGESVFYLTQTTRDSLIEAEKTDRFLFEYDFIAPTTTPPPIEVWHHAYHLNLYESKTAPCDPALGFGDVTVGHSPVAGVAESGFHGVESNQFGPFRWTTANWHLNIPLREGYRPRSVILNIGDLSPKGCELVVHANEVEIHRVFHHSAPGRIEIDLPAVFEDSILDLRVENDIFVPAEIDGRGSDQRALGLMLYGVSLSAQPASKGDFELGIAPMPGVGEGGFHDPEVNEAGPYRWTDGAAWLELPLPAGYVVRSIDVNILDISPKGADLEILVNGEPVHRNSYTSPPGTIAIDVAEFPPTSEGDVLRLDLRSTTFRPVDLDMGQDERVLGVRVHGIVVSDRQRED
ncbi:MAG: hypothetical protein DRP71_11825 [Verrucomicrobia bacterium]|nr:MAG: hypothetical protein DRP71_11825 [Verrucomicrobiota bacterium]